MYGKEFKPAGILLSLFSIRLFFTNMGVARSIYILVENLFNFSLVTMIIGTISNITINYFLIPIYHAKGAIIATIISFFITIFLIDFFYKKTRNNIKLIFKGIMTFYKIELKLN